MSPGEMVKATRATVVLAIVLFAALYVRSSIHWPMLEDGPVMHYVNFLMSHGMRPYSDITDNNMPGAYLTEGWAMRIFGGGDLAWRIYDFFLGAVLIAAMIVITWPFDWLAGFFGGGLFLVVHAAEGPRYAGEREQVIAVAFAVAYAALFEAVRRRKPLLMGVCGVAGAIAVSIKPTFTPLLLLMLVLAAFELRRHQVPIATYLGWGFAGALAVTAKMLAFLIHYHAVSDFLYILRVITPSYHDLWPATLSSMLTRMFPPALVPVLVVSIILALARRTRWTWEQWALLMGALIGLSSYFIQHKAFLHHRYTWLALSLVLCALELTPALRQAGWRRATACLALLFVCFVCLPRYGQLLRTYASTNELVTSLERDLATVGNANPSLSLSGQVECFDLVSGCLSALYHMNLVENSGFTGDLLFFRRTVTPTALYYRNMFWDRARQNPPNILVITNEWFGEKDSFEKIDTWPEFAKYVRMNYRLVAQREFPNLDTRSQPDGSKEARGYRIYVRAEEQLFPRVESSKE